MRHKYMSRMLLGFAFLALALAARAASGDGRPGRLPAFDVLDREGATVAGRSLAREGAWFLAYVEARPDAAEPILAILAREVPPERLAVIVAGGPDEAAALAARF